MESREMKAIEMKTNRLQPFSYAYYEHMLKLCIDEGYTISSFKDYHENHARTIILRNDVDIDSEILDIVEDGAKKCTSDDYVYLKFELIK